MAALTLLKRAHVYAPDDLGVGDILIAGRQIAAIERGLQLTGNVPIDVIDLDGRPTLYLQRGLPSPHPDPDGHAEVGSRPD